MAVKELKLPVEQDNRSSRHERLTLAGHYLEKNISSGISIEIPSLNVSISIPSQDRNNKTNE